MNNKLNKKQSQSLHSFKLQKILLIFKIEQ